MARHGRNLTAREKKQITELTSGSVDPTLYLVISELAINRTERVLRVRHKVSGEEFEVTLPK